MNRIAVGLLSIAGMICVSIGLWIEHAPPGVVFIAAGLLTIIGTALELLRAIADGVDR